jgi:hypothetical protein
MEIRRRIGMVKITFYEKKIDPFMKKDRYHSQQKYIENMHNMYI